MAKKRIRPGMVAFADKIGAMKGGRPDWYLVAERLAEITLPELLVEQPSGRGPGRPLRGDFLLAWEIHRTMAEYRCSARKACQRITQGKNEKSETWNRLPLPTREGLKPRYTVGSEWREANPSTLYQRYLRWKKLEGEYQEKHAIEIP
jgi:hypothetical protein